MMRVLRRAHGEDWFDCLARLAGPNRALQLDAMQAFEDEVDAGKAEDAAAWDVAERYDLLDEIDYVGSEVTHVD